jgi:hypothetical protein
MSCQSAAVSERRRSDGGTFDAAALQYTRDKQSGTTTAARNNRKEWTGPELEYLSTTRDTEAVQAERLGRTIYALRHIKRKMKSEPKIARLAGLDTDVARKATP